MGLDPAAQSDIVAEVAEPGVLANTALDTKIDTARDTGLDTACDTGLDTARDTGLEPNPVDHLDTVRSNVAAKPAREKKKKNRQVHWMITDRTQYRNEEHNARCTFYSNLRDASDAFYSTVGAAIDQLKHDSNYDYYDNVHNTKDEFFNMEAVKGRTYHKSRAFECGGVHVYLSEVHLGQNYCVLLGGSES